MATDLTGFMPEETGAEQLRVESFFKPNLALIDRVLATRQTMYNTNLDAMAKAKAKVDEVNALEGFDKEEWFKMQEDYDKQIEGIMSLYEGDLSKANAELYGFSNKVGKDFGIHGKATAINERALGYMMNKKELDKRLSEGKIEHGQYWRLNEELEKTKDIGIGTDPKAYNSWRKINPIDAINFDEFAVKFLTTKESDLKASGYTRSYDPAGFYIWTNVNQDVITYDSVLKELGDAFRNAADRTGQLVDDFDYNIYKNQIKMTNEEYVTKYTAEANKKKSVVEQLKATPKTNEERIAQHKLLNQLQGKQTQATGILTASDVTAKNLIIEKYTESAEEYEAEAEKVKVLNNDELRSYYYQDYTNAKIRRLADPYAGSKSRDKISIQRDVQRDPMLELEIHRRKKEIDREFDNVEAIITTSEGMMLVDGKANESMNTVLSGLNLSKKELETELDDLRKQMKKAPNDQLRNRIATLEKQHGSIVAKIATVSQAQFTVDEGMKNLGMKSNSDLVNNHVSKFIKNIKADQPENKQFNTNHYNAIVVMDAQTRKKLFGTDDIETIKKQKINDVNSKIYNYYHDVNEDDFFSFNLFNPTNNEKLTKASTWLKENLYDNSYDMTYEASVGASSYGLMPTYVHGGVPINPLRDLRNNVSFNTDKYMQRSNQNIMTEQTELFSTDPTKGNFALNSLRSAYADALHTNPQGFVDKDFNQATIKLKNQKFKDSENKEAFADLSQTKPEDIAIAKKPIHGVMYMQVRLRDRKGNLLFESDGTPATQWVVPEQQTKWNGNVKTVALENINGLLQRVVSKKANYDKATLSGNLSMNERLQYFDTDNENYLNYLSQLSGVNHVIGWQQNGLHSVKQGGALYMPDGTGNYYAIARGYYNNGVWTPSSQWAMYSAKPDANGNIVIDPNQKEPYTLVAPSLGTKLGVYAPNHTRYFNSPEELANAIEFTNQFEIK